MPPIPSEFYKHVSSQSDDLVARRYLKRLLFSASLARGNPSRPAQILNNPLDAKNPAPSPGVSPIPSSRKDFAVNLVLGFGLRRRLKEGNIEGGIDPRDDGGGGAWGGKIVDGGGWP